MKMEMQGLSLPALICSVYLGMNIYQRRLRLRGRGAHDLDPIGAVGVVSLLVTAIWCLNELLNPASAPVLRGHGAHDSPMGLDSPKRNYSKKLRADDERERVRDPDENVRLQKEHVRNLKLRLRSERLLAASNNQLDPDFRREYQEMIALIGQLRQQGQLGEIDDILIEVTFDHLVNQPVWYTELPGSNDATTRFVFFGRFPIPVDRDEGGRLYIDLLHHRLWLREEMLQPTPSLEPRLRQLYRRPPADLNKLRSKWPRFQEQELTSIRNGSSDPEKVAFVLNFIHIPGFCFRRVMTKERNCRTFLHPVPQNWSIYNFEEYNTDAPFDPSASHKDTELTRKGIYKILWNQEEVQLTWTYLQAYWVDVLYYHKPIPVPVRTYVNDGPFLQHHPRLRSFEDYLNTIFDLAQLYDLGRLLAQASAAGMECDAQVFDFACADLVLYGASERAPEDLAQLRDKCESSSLSLEYAKHYAENCVRDRFSQFFMEDFIAAATDRNNKLCTDVRVQHTYFDYVPCINAKAGRGIFYCNGNFSLTLQSIVLEPVDDRMGLACCQLKKYIKCVTRQVSKCGVRAAAFAQKLIKDAAGTGVQSACLNAPSNATLCKTLRTLRLPSTSRYKSILSGLPELFDYHFAPQ